MSETAMVVCTICGRVHERRLMNQIDWLAPDVIARMATDNPHWKRSDGACPACVQKALLQILLEQGDEAAHRSIQSVWPLDAESAFGALPTPLRMHADPRFSGKGVTIAFIDSGFYPHPDLTQPVNRIKAWVDAGSEDIESEFYTPDDAPTWRGYDDGMPSHWHGLMTSTTCAGNGWLSNGLYRGIASEAELVLIQVMDARGWITNDSIARALHWLEANLERLGVRVVNISLGGDPVEVLVGNAIDSAIERLLARGVAFSVAAGNNGERYLNPPATSPHALTVGGLDDHNLFDHAHLSLWHGNYGVGSGGGIKPEIVAPSIWVVAPILPGSGVAREAAELFSKRIYKNSQRMRQIEDHKLVTPHYQHVDGTSFAAPIVTSIMACMIEANPELTPVQVNEILLWTAHRIPGVPVERQGYGAVEAGHAIAAATAERMERGVGFVQFPRVEADKITFLFHDHDVQQVQVVGSWNGWRLPGLLAVAKEPGVFLASTQRFPKGRYAYKFVLDGERPLHDPANPNKVFDGIAGFNSVLEIRD